MNGLGVRSRILKIFGRALQMIEACSWPDNSPLTKRKSATLCVLNSSSLKPVVLILRQYHPFALSYHRQPVNILGIFSEMVAMHLHARAQCFEGISKQVAL